MTVGLDRSAFPGRVSPPRIVVPQALSGFSDFDWVRVTGQIQFLQVPGQNRYIPVIMVADIRDVVKEEPKNEYEQ